MEHLVWGQSSKRIGKKTFLLGHGLRRQGSPSGRQEQPLASPLGLTLYKVFGNQFGEQLADISLGDQQRICQLVLSQPLAGSDARQDVEPGHIQSERAEIQFTRVVDLLVEPYEPIPSGDRGRPIAG